MASPGRRSRQCDRRAEPRQAVSCFGKCARACACKGATWGVRPDLNVSPRRRARRRSRQSELDAGLPSRASATALWGASSLPPGAQASSCSGSARKYGARARARACAVRCGPVPRPVPPSNAAAQSCGRALQPVSSRRCPPRTAVSRRLRAERRARRPRRRGPSAPGAVPLASARDGGNGRAPGATSATSRPVRPGRCSTTLLLRRRDGESGFRARRARRVRALCVLASCVRVCARVLRVSVRLAPPRARIRTGRDRVRV